ncbi:MAG: hypothetical protein ACREGG_01945 [Candidatus Saccharimonadales bacterium]
MPRTVRKTLISSLMLLVLIVIGATAYTYYTDRKAPSTAPAKALAAYKPPSLPKPSTPAPNIAEGAAVEAIDSPVSAGQNTSLTIQTNRGSTCTISVVYGNVTSKDSGLTPKKTDDYGIITWSWTVGKTAAVGTWPIKVLCTYTNGKTALVEANLQVTK